MKTLLYPVLAVLLCGVLCRSNDNKPVKTWKLDGYELMWDNENRPVFFPKNTNPVVLNNGFRAVLLNKNPVPVTVDKATRPTWDVYGCYHGYCWRKTTLGKWCYLRDMKADKGSRAKCSGHYQCASEYLVCNSEALVAAPANSTKVRRGCYNERCYSGCPAGVGRGWCYLRDKNSDNESDRAICSYDYQCESELLVCSSGMCK